MGVQAPGQAQGPGHSQLPVQVRDPGPQEASLLDAANPGSSSLPPVLPTAPLSSSGDEYFNANSAPGFHGAVGDLRTLGKTSEDSTCPPNFYDLGLDGLRYSVPPPPLGFVPALGPSANNYVQRGPGYFQFRGEIYTLNLSFPDLLLADALLV